MSVPQSLVSKSFVLNRMRVHAHFYLSNYPMLRDTCTVEEAMSYFDRDMQRCFTLLADMAKGETVDETRQVKQDFTFDAFATWWDHLKFQWKSGRVGWLPESWKKAIRIRYQPVTKSKSLTVSVKVTRACPHVTASWSDRPDLHVAFLRPMEWDAFRTAARPPAS